MADTSSTLTIRCEEREFLRSAEAMWREAAVVIEQPMETRAGLADAAIRAQRERHRHEENCALCQQIAASKKATPEIHLAAAD
jgi:hypothetical protein